MVEHIARVRWSAHGREVASYVSAIRNKQDMYVDCLLKCKGGELLPAHRVILAMASPFFNCIFRTISTVPHVPMVDQIIVLEGVEVEQMEALLQYMYFGYAIVKCDKLPALSRIAKSLGIKEFPTLEIAPPRPITPKATADIAVASLKRSKDFTSSKSEKSSNNNGQDEGLSCMSQRKRPRVESREKKFGEDILPVLQESPLKTIVNSAAHFRGLEDCDNRPRVRLHSRCERSPISPIDQPLDRRNKILRPLSSSNQSMIKPEEIKLEGPDDDDDLIEVCRVTDEAIEVKTAIQQEQPMEDHSSSSASLRRPSLDPNGLLVSERHSSDGGSHSVPPRNIQEPPSSSLKRPSSAPTATTPSTTSASNDNTTPEIQTKKDTLKEEEQDMTIDVEGLGEASDEQSEQPKTGSLPKRQMPVTPNTSSEFEDQTRINYRAANEEEQFRMNCGHQSRSDVKKQTNKPGPPGLLSMVNEDDYRRYREVSQGILRETLIRRNPMIAVPSPTRVSISEHHHHHQHPPVQHSHHPQHHLGMIPKGQSYFPLKTIYSKPGTPVPQTHPRISDYYKPHHEIHRPYGHMRYPPPPPEHHHPPHPPPTLPLTLPQADALGKAPHHVNGLSSSQTANSTRSSDLIENCLPPNHQDQRHPSSRYDYHPSLNHSHNNSPHQTGDATPTTAVTTTPEGNDDPLLSKISTTKRKRVRGPKSWEFLLRLLRDPSTNPSLIRWENEKEGTFRLVKPDAIALRWGKRTGKHFSDMLSYENFARGLRYHYVTGALSAVSERCFVYKFGPKAEKALKSTMDVLDITAGEQNSLAEGECGTHSPPLT